MVTEVRTEPRTEFEARVLAAKYGDLRTFNKAVHNWEFEPHQDAWAVALEEETYICIVCPPDSRKTSTVRTAIERMIGRNKDIRVLWLQKAGEQSERNVMSVARTIESNNVYKMAFGIEPDAKAQWTKSSLYVKRDDTSDPSPTLMGCGLNGPYQGSHFNVIVIDDPTNQDDPRSPTTMMAQEEKLRGVILDRLSDGGRIVAILTRWGENDLVPIMADMGFKVVEMPIMADYPWGGTISPKMFPPDRIDRIRRQKGSAIFDLTYMCNPEAAKGNVIRRENIGYWDQSNMPQEGLQIFIGVDPAASVKTMADYTAMATVGYSPRTKIIYLLDMWTKRVETHDLELEIIKRAKRTSGLRGVAVETAGFQVSILQNLKRQYQLPIREIPYRTSKSTVQREVAIDRDKVGRAMYLDSLFCQGRLLLPKTLPLVEGISLEHELCTIPFSKHDDRMDALAFACIIAEGAVKRITRRRIDLYGSY